MKPIEESEQVSEITFGRDVLMVEAEAIRIAAGRLDSAFEKAVDLLDQCVGKIVTIGVGKSGIVAHKLAATLTSTGCPAVFLHPSEAMHGDLGIVLPQDVVIVLSHSGESEEVVALLPTLLARGVPLLGILGNFSSTLAQRSTVVIDASIKREACPLNLAPTTSVAVALALGDALAMTLQRRRNFDAASFALNHPGGRLGRRLTLRVRDVMPVRAETVPSVSPEAGFGEVVCLVTEGHMGAVCVAEPEGTLIGIVAESEIRNALSRYERNAFDLTARDLMNTKPSVILRPEQLAYDALLQMTDRPRALSVAPVTDDTGRCIGMVRVNDLVKAGL